jgi:hypothetical protein
MKIDDSGGPILHEIRVLNQTGDTKTAWNPTHPDEVESARELFNSLKKKGFLIYASKDDGKKGEVMHEFDPKAGKLIAVPRVVGG